MDNASQTEIPQGWHDNSPGQARQASPARTERRLRNRAQKIISLSPRRASGERGFLN
jgi:hypothetical protein